MRESAQKVKLAEAFRAAGPPDALSFCRADEEPLYFRAPKVVPVISHQVQNESAKR